MMDSSPRAGIRSSSHTSRVLIWSMVLATLLICVAGPCVLSASEEKLPKAEVILDKYVEVTGGKAAYDRIANRVTKSTLEIVGQGIKMSITAYAAKPRKTYVLVESAAFGTIKSGTNDGVAWETSAMRGPRIKKDKEKADALRDALFAKSAHWRKTHKEAECVGIETVGDKPCYKITVTPHEGSPQTLYYDQKSSLLVMVESVVESPMGTIPIQTFLSDYREVDGILIAHKANTMVMGQQRVMTTESVEHNVEMPEDRFTFPERIQALADQEKSEALQIGEPEGDRE